MPEEAISRFDVVVRQGVAGLQMKQTDIFQAERAIHLPRLLGDTRATTCNSRKSIAWI